MKTYFAEPERYSQSTVSEQARFIAEHGLVHSLMEIIQGFFAVLNDKRQIIAINNNFLRNLDIDKAEDIFGLRLGETIQCVHADLMEGGCGTSEYCSTCGAAISIVAALKKKEISEKICSIRVHPKGHQKDIYFKVKSAPVDIEENSFVLIFLEDITYEHKMAELEKLFFHDIYNKVSGIINGCEILKYQNTENSDIVDIIYDLTYQMVREIEFQKNLLLGDLYNFVAEKEMIELNRIYEDLNRVFFRHSVTKGKILQIPDKSENFRFYSDISIVIRVLTNMIKNALENTKDGGKVTVNHRINEKFIIFEVWNAQYIENSYARQIFKRNFSTKRGLGHGFGTYSMKVLGEDVLGGIVSFSTSQSEGTTFRFKIPLENI